jgi:phospholipid N-methyltransferase
LINEVDNIKRRYEVRKNKSFNDNKWFVKFLQIERELRYFKIISSFYKELDSRKIMEIGAGSGDNLIALKRFGFRWSNIYANELLDDRVSILEQNLPNSHIYKGDALELEFEEHFDIVFQSTLFTSVLDFEFKKKLANKMMKMTKKCGLILWYDFKYNNPNNKDVKGISKTEINRLFPNAKKIKFYNTTLAPPIARRVGKLYNIINFLFPILRTHIVAVIYK